MSELDFTPLPLAGLRWSQSPEAILVESPEPLDILCSGVVGGGLIRARHILNLHVDKDYHGPDPAADLQAFARRLGVDGPFAGLMTAAWVHLARPLTASDRGLGVCVLATIGMGNATTAGVSLPPGWAAPASGEPPDYRPGTINLIVMLDANPAPAALVNLAITVTEAKCAFLRRLGWTTAGGSPATGTSTDAVAIAATGRGPQVSYAGPATPAGYLAARLVSRALEAYA